MVSVKLLSSVGLARGLPRAPSLSFTAKGRLLTSRGFNHLGPGGFRGEAGLAGSPPLPREGGAGSGARQGLSWGILPLNLSWV